MVRENSIDHTWLLSKSLYDLSTEFRMICLALSLRTLSYIMKQSSSLCDLRIRTDLARYHTGKNRDLF